MTIRIVTIGVYGFTAETFFQALQAAGVDTLVDIRQRRGVRGAAYAFANSQRLQARLDELGIRYLHQIELAPTAAVRRQQAAADKKHKIARRKRESLDEAFIEAFVAQVLADFDSQAWLVGLPADASVVALLCVEREPTACHRGLVADRLQQELGLEVVHITP
jgi:uncharacterized protein (DUF488 family)